MIHGRRSLLAIAMAFALLVPATASTTVFSDTFTEGVTVVLASHTPSPTGTAWVEAFDSNAGQLASVNSAGYAFVSTNATSASLIYTATPNPSLGSADYDVTVTVLLPLTGQTADFDPFYLVARYIDVGGTLSYYALGVTGANDPHEWRLLKNASGVVSTLASGSVNVAANDVFKLSLRVDTIKAYQNGVQMTGGCAVDATLTSAGSFGMAWGNISFSATADTNGGWRLDNFIGSDETGSGGDDNCGAGGSPKRLLLLGVGGR